MPNTVEIVSSLNHHCQLAEDPREALAKCCRELLDRFGFDAVFLAHAQNVQIVPQPLASAGNEELLTRISYRIGIEDRLAFLKQPGRVLTDITGKPTFTASGTLRIQRPSSGIFSAVELPDKHYLMMGLVHQEARRYENREPEEVAAVWHDWNAVLLNTAAKAVERSRLEAAAQEAAAAPADPDRLDRLHLPLVPDGSLGDAPPSDRSVSRSVEMVDENTRLFNRNYFEESLTIEVERSKRYQRDISLILLSVTAVQPIHGEDDWNKLSVRVAEILLKSLRRTDIVCRYDRNKFALILPDTAHQTLGIIAKRIFRFFREAMGSDPVAYLNLSTASFPKSAEGDRALLAKAEDLLNQAVAAGPNKAVLAE